MANNWIRSYDLPSELQSINSSNVSMEYVLGRGSYGVVMKAKWISRNRDVAAKIIQTNNTNLVIREIQIMHRLKHPNVIQVFGYGKMSNGDVFFLMELMDNGSLDKVLHDKETTILLEKLNDWTVQIASGLAFIHEKSHIHRDLKPLNIMLSNNQKCVKIGDFGTARDELILMTRGIGTPLYMAPEVFGTSSYTSKCDVYSFGITLCEMYTRRRPYEGRWDDAMLMVKIRNGLRPTMHDDDVMVSEQMRSIIKRCWNKDSNLRPSLSSILNESIFRNNDQTKLINNNGNKVQKPSDNHKVNDNDDDIQIAQDVTKGERERINACIRLAYIWRENITADQMSLISRIIIYANKQHDHSTITQLSQSYSHRLHLIDAIVIDYTNICTSWWLSLYADLIYDCFYFNASKFDNGTEFDRKIRRRICQLIIDKLRFVLSDRVWLRVDWSTQDDRIFILYHFTHLLVEYRIETNADDRRLLTKRCDQMNQQHNISHSNNSYIKEIVYRIEQIKRYQSEDAPAPLNWRRRSNSFRQ